MAGLTVEDAPDRVGALAAAHGIVLHELLATAELERALFRLLQDATPDTSPADIAEAVA